MSDGRRRLWDLVRSRAAAARRGPRLGRISREGPLQLSFAQEQLWFLDRLHPGQAAYNESNAFRWQGRVDPDRLARAIAELVSRHEILRTVFPAVDGAPTARVTDTVDARLERRTLGAPGSESSDPGGPVDRLEAARDAASTEARRPFDLARGPLIRFLLLRLEDEDHVLVVTVHHIVWDQRSLDLFMRELVRRTTADAAAPGELESPDVQYLDFAAWERERLSEDALESCLEAWRTRLAGAIEPLSLPVDHPAPVHRSFAGATHWFGVGAPLAERCRALATDSGTTLHAVLAAAFVAVLARTADAEDVRFGSPFSRRDRPELEPMLGVLTNTVVLRVDVSGDPSFGELARRVGEVTLDAYEHQDAPFGSVVEALRPRRTLATDPLLQVMFTLYPPDRAPHSRTEHRLTPLEFETGTARFDLELYVWETANGLRGKFVVRAELFEPDSIERLARHLQTTLERVTEDPAVRVSALPFLSEDERHCRDAANDATTGAPAVVVHRLFAERVARAPDEPAVVDGRRSITAGELDAAASRVAGALRERGVDAGVRVGVCAPRSIEAIVAMLATLKAGAAYVPIDPASPPRRRRFIERDAGLRIVLSLEDEPPDQNDDGTGPRRLLVDELSSAPPGPGGPHDRDPAAEVSDDAPAYVVYTSGSTGSPKGVVVPHRAVVRLARNTGDIAVRPDDRVAQAANLSFDAATYEIWGALLNGATLHIVPDDLRLSPRALVETLRCERISVLFLTTSLFNTVAAEKPDGFESVRLLLFGGEAVAPQAVRRVLAAGPPRRLVHVYGPTENTTFSTSHVVREVPRGASTVPLGRPIDDTQAYVLDRHLRVSPVGVHGELFLGGRGLASGYLNRPELTDASFVPSPFDDGRTLLYRTGDVVRALANGDLEFVGRTDAQLKVRGFRVEPAEIEAALTDHPSVRSAMVVARRPGSAGDDPAAPWLTACVVLADDRTPSLAELRRFVGERLPDAMVPSAFVPVESLPRTPGGKLDRRLAHGEVADLVDARAREPDGGEESTPSATSPTERRLARIWRKVLWLDRDVGANDNFFDLGGHSLLAVRLVAEIERDFETELPVAALFRLDTVRALAAHLDATPASTARSPVDEEAVRANAANCRTIIVIDSSLPYDDQDSGSHRMAWILKLLRRHDWHVIFVPDNDVMAEPYASRLAESGVDVLHTKFDRGADATARQQLVDALPAADVVWICKPDPFEEYAPLVRRLSRATLVYDTVDLHYVRLKGAADRGGPRGSSESWQRMRERELANARTADVTIALTGVERDTLDDASVGEVVVVPNIHAPRRGERRPFGDRHGVLFIGSYAHSPNVDAAVWLCEAIMPRVWKKAPEIGVTLLGSRPNALVHSLASDRVTVTGFVEDVAPAFERHRVFVAPLLYGAGMKGKVGQSLQFGLPIVSTPVGSEGMDLVPETDVLEARTAREFAAQILRLHRDEGLWNLLSSHADEKLLPFTPDRIGERLGRLLEEWT